MYIFHTTLGMHSPTAARDWGIGFLSLPEHPARLPSSLKALHISAASYSETKRDLLDYLVCLSST